MKYRILGSTGLKVSVVGVGTWQFGGEWAKTFQQDEVDAMFDRARELGLNLIDTAECYGDHTSEAFIGRAPAVHEHREDWIIATKFGHKFHAPFKRDEAINPQSVKRQLEDSLRALRTDYVDLYQFHSLSDEAFDTDRLWETLQREKEAGRIRHLGVSIGSNRNTYQTDKAPDVGAEAIQVVYNRLDRAPEEEVLPLCEKHNLGVLARVPLASGYLSGKYSPADAESFAKNDVRGRWHGANKARQSLEEAQRIKEEEVPEGVDMAQWALAWCLTHPAVTCVIPGCKTVGQVASNAAAAALDLVREDHPQAV